MFQIVWAVPNLEKSLEMKSLHIYQILMSHEAEYLIGGFGLGLMYVPAVVAVGYWFEKRRSLVTGTSLTMKVYIYVHAYCVQIATLTW